MTDKTTEQSAAEDAKRPVDVLVSKRDASIALMFAEIHSEDGDCLGVAASELMRLLDNKGIKLPEDFDC